MKLTSNFIKFHNELGIKKTIDVFAAAGFDGIEFNADLEEYHNDTHDKAFYEEIRQYAQSRGIFFPQAHAPFASSFEDDQKSAKRFDEIVKSMEHCSWLGVENIIVHPCKHLNYKEDGNYEIMFNYNLDFYTRLIPFAKKYNIKIAIENINGSITETPEGLLKLLDTLSSDVFTICYDIGHANIIGIDTADMIRALKNRITCTHIHDNDGIHDSHTLPFCGTIDWENAMKAFAEVGYTGNLNYEAGYFVKTAPVCLREQSAKYMVCVGRYLIERLEYYKNV